MSVKAVSAVHVTWHVRFVYVPLLHSRRSDEAALDLKGWAAPRSGCIPIASAEQMKSKYGTNVFTVVRDARWPACRGVDEFGWAVVLLNCLADQQTAWCDLFLAVRRVAS